ncbi:lipopolysaccharide assembly protein LapB [Xenococcus sp. PCC 7305]|uniref:tetratricopeptide repeat protein n=1 Tax=Xenococcus sp. PCC 7305 TaxID=102125 RepID=UPI00118184F7|nr:tetratricopeptide repeat protein [Xenococcus sp. PCC 7305]
MNNLVSSDRIFSEIIKHSTIVLLTILGIVVPSTIHQKIVIAQTDVFDPLATPQSDPLLPPLNVKRELTPLEKTRVRNAIIEIDQEAKNQLAQGNVELAFELWFRELRLQKAIGLNEEIVDLGRIGAIAWQENLGENLRVIARRLSVIEQEATAADNRDLELFTNLGTAYQEIRYLDRAVNIYEQILTEIRKEDNPEEEEELLTILGDLYLAKFDYVEAGIVYEELLSLVQQDIKDISLDEPDLQQTYLLKLVDIYDSSKQPEKAIVIKEQLVEKYAEQEQPEQIASLKISLAADYQAIDELELAQKSYQEAFILAQYLQQIALANESLEKLAILYQTSDQLILATQTYLQLFEVQEQANNAYALLNICDRLGELYLLQNDYDQALNYYSQGLEFAQLLNYRTEYFQTQIRELRGKM